MKTNEGILWMPRARYSGVAGNPFEILKAIKNQAFPNETALVYSGTKRLGKGHLIKVEGTGIYDGCYVATRGGSYSEGLDGPALKTVYIAVPFTSTATGQIKQDADSLAYCQQVVTQQIYDKATENGNLPNGNGNGNGTITAEEGAGFFAKNKMNIIIVAAIALLVGAVMYFKK